MPDGITRRPVINTSNDFHSWLIKSKLAALNKSFQAFASFSQRNTLCAANFKQETGAGVVAKISREKERLACIVLSRVLSGVLTVQL